MPDIKPHLERNLAQAEALGQTERAKKLKERLVKENKPAEDVDPVDEFHTGGGWYEIDGEKYHGKEAAREALEA